MPVGGRACQVLTLVENTDEGFARETLEPVVFVPLIGGTS
jgi:protein-L-isoaspartate O-methyltransferase